MRFPDIELVPWPQIGVAVAVTFFIGTWMHRWDETDPSPDWQNYETPGYYRGAANLPLAQTNLKPWLQAYQGFNFAEIAWSEVRLNPFGILDANGYLSAGLTIHINDYGVPSAQYAPSTPSCRYWKNIYPGGTSSELCGGGLCYPVDVECDSNIVLLNLTAQPAASDDPRLKSK